jgi:hypothetical protein
MTRHFAHACRRRSSGLAIVAAVVLIGMAGVVFVALTSLVRHDLRRTAQARGEAQLRQLLLAGEAAAARSVGAPGQGGQNVTLPAELSADGATLSFTTGDADGETRVVNVDAAFAGLHASQRLTYQRRDGRWVVVGAELSPTSGSLAH